jgi:hypothetical protein
MRTRKKRKEVKKLHLPFDYPPRSSIYYLYLPISLAMTFALLLKRPILPRLKKKDWLWPVIGIISGLALGMIIGLVI